MTLAHADGPSWLPALDLAAPLALGARGLIIGPPNSGKTTILRELALSLLATLPDVQVHVVVVDQPLEELLEWRYDVIGATITGTTSEDSPEAHAATLSVFDDAAERAADGHDTVVLVDSLAAVARALNATMELDERILTGGIMATALRSLRERFGRARALEPDGSLTIVGTVTMGAAEDLDTVVMEELMGTGNLEYHLDPSALAAGLFPPLDIERSGARGLERIVGEDEAERRAQLRSLISMHGISAGLDLLYEHLAKHGTLPEA